jgi:hypothetical protein
MALRAVNSPNHPPREERRQENAPAVAACPICDGRMEAVYNRHNQKVCVCEDCHTGITVPGTAWEIARIKRDGKWMPKG